MLQPLQEDRINTVHQQPTSLSHLTSLKCRHDITPNRPTHLTPLPQPSAHATLVAGESGVSILAGAYALRGAAFAGIGGLARLVTRGVRGVPGPIMLGTGRAGPENGVQGDGLVRRGARDLERGVSAEAERGGRNGGQWDSRWRNETSSNRQVR